MFMDIKHHGFHIKAFDNCEDNKEKNVQGHSSEYREKENKSKFFNGNTDYLNFAIFRCQTMTKGKKVNPQ